MTKLLLTLLMMFAFGTSTVNAEVDKLSEDELKTIIVNVNELTEPTEDDLAIKEAATNKLELSPLSIRMGIIGLVLMLCALIIGHRIPPYE